MSTEEVAAHLNELPNRSVTGLLLGMALKYGLPSICCIWLFYVIWCKDRQIYDMATQTTSALVESNHARTDGNEAIEKLGEAINKLANRTP